MFDNLYIVVIKEVDGYTHTQPFFRQEQAENFLATAVKDYIEETEDTIIEDIPLEDVKDYIHDWHAIAGHEGWSGWIEMFDLGYICAE